MPLTLSLFPLKNLPLTAGLFHSGCRRADAATGLATIDGRGLRGFHEQRWANLLGGGLLGGPIPTAVFLLLFLGYAAVQPPSFISAAWMTCLGAYADDVALLGRSEIRIAQALKGC